MPLSQEGTSQPEEISSFAMFLKNGLSSSVKNVMASPDLPALPDRPIHTRQKLMVGSVVWCLQQMLTVSKT
jgi:hypothetical protein